MNRGANHEKQLEMEIAAHLQQLGELTAPATLAPRVMQAIARRETRPWYRNSLETWPLAIRTASVFGLLVLFASLYFGVWKLDQAGAGQGSRVFSEWLPEVTALYNVVKVLGDVGQSLLAQIRPEVIGLVIAIFFLAWVALLGIGTVCIRVATRPNIYLK
jgi:hypothetical protein